MDSAHNFKRAGLGVVILDHKGNYFKYSVWMNFQVTNIMTLKKLGVNNIILYNDSWLVVNQYMG